MRRINIIVIAFLTLISLQKLHSQALYPSYWVGLGYSGASGAGLNVSMDLNPTWTFKLSGFPYFFNDTEKPIGGDSLSGFKERNLNVGLEAQYNLYKGLENRFFILGGASLWHIELINSLSGKTNEVAWTRERVRKDRIYNLGIGAGWQYKFSELFSVTLDAHYLYQTSDSVRVSELFDRSPGGKVFNGVFGGLTIQFHLR